MDTGPGPIEDQLERGSRSGFTILLYALLGIGAAGALTCGALVYVAAQDPSMREAVSSLIGATTAPGTAELRAAGCEVATVLDFSAAMAVMQRVSERASDAEPLMLLTVQCGVTDANAQTLGCEDVAQLYIDAVAPDRRFFVQVTELGQREPLCQQVYEADGTSIGTLEEYAAGVGVDAPEAPEPGESAEREAETSPAPRP